ncbi:hypothetical protein HMPREF9104_02358 [Lentilactobacillus kisonensis F0435]|uniref:Uncharacterized protein n=1 Tax=Lentilactobacillus kisonensis F0435 TaxID=797516 RepID=H1LIB7_9LACO|nr:hypothetical protein HMPREF9104_02358 [Lentilactobacillus kisonensis F0435]
MFPLLLPKLRGYESKLNNSNTVSYSLNVIFFLLVIAAVIVGLYAMIRYK